MVFAMGQVLVCAIDQTHGQEIDVEMVSLHLISFNNSIRCVIQTRAQSDLDKSKDVQLIYCTFCY